MNKSPQNFVIVVFNRKANTDKSLNILSRSEIVFLLSVQNAKKTPKSEHFFSKGITVTVTFGQKLKILKHQKYF